MTKRQIKTIISMIIFLVGVGIAAARGNFSDPFSTSPPLGNEEAYVEKVIDGDTIEVKLNTGETEKVRLIGIDTPETKDPRKPVQCFGKEAAAKTKELVEKKVIRLEKDQISDAIDKYGRQLRWVYQGGALVNAELVKQGYAYAYTQFPFSKKEEFEQLQKEAKEKQLGLWNPAACATP